MAMTNLGTVPSRGDLQPPHISYRRFRKLLNQIASKRPSGQLNPDAWGAPSQSANRFTHALRFFGLVTRELIPQWELHQFARANVQDRRAILRKVVMSRFGWLDELSGTSSYQEFRTTFGRHCTLTGEPLTRAASFLLSAASDLEIELPVARPRPGPRAKSPSEAAFADNSGLRAGLYRSVENHSAFLLEQAKRSARHGDVDRENDYLQKLDRISLAILESTRSSKEP